MISALFKVNRLSLIFIVLAPETTFRGWHVTPLENKYLLYNLLFDPIVASTQNYNTRDEHTNHYTIDVVDLRWEVIVRFDISEIVDLHCFNFSLHNYFWLEDVQNVADLSRLMGSESSFLDIKMFRCFPFT